MVSKEFLVPSWNGVYPKEEFENAFVIGLAGYTGVGKTTVAEAVIDQLKSDETVCCLRLSFAQRLKEVLATLVDEDRDFNLAQNKTVSIYAGGDWDVRDFLTNFATEFVRDKIGENFWTDVVAKRLASLEEPTVAVIDDLRFINEAVLVSSLGIAILLEGQAGEPSFSHRSEEPEKLGLKHIVRNDDTPQKVAREVLRLAGKISIGQVIRLITYFMFM